SHCRCQLSECMFHSRGVVGRSPELCSPGLKERCLWFGPFSPDSFQIGLCRCFEEESSLRYKVGQQMTTFFDECHYRFQLLHGYGNAFFGEKGSGQFGQSLVAGTLYMLMIEPLRFFVIEFGSAFMYTFHTEYFAEFVQAENFLFGTRIPAQ